MDFADFGFCVVSAGNPILFYGKSFVALLNFLEKEQQILLHILFFLKKSNTICCMF